MCRSSSRLLCPWQETVSVHADVRMFPSDQYPPTGPRANRGARTGASRLSRSARTDGSANAVAKQQLPSSATASRLEMRLGVTVQLPLGSIAARLGVTPAQIKQFVPASPRSHGGFYPALWAASLVSLDCE